MLYEIEYCVDCPDATANCEMFVVSYIAWAFFTVPDMIPAVLHMNQTSKVGLRALAELVSSDLIIIVSISISVLLH
jgi:hypothetical protein